MANSKEFHSSPVDRRDFLRQAAASAAIGTAALSTCSPAIAGADKPALLGGMPVRQSSWPSWPFTDQAEEQALVEVLRSGSWYRYRAGADGTVANFEKTWAETIGTSYCQATANGTSSLVTALAALEIGPGDEVLVPPYTFIATINAVLLLHALPVFVDSDFDTALMDPDKIEARINSQTRAVIPVHVAGAPCEMDRIRAVTGRHGIKIVEDACQAHTGEWRGARVGSLGDAGCFSFQNSKNITSGEGGAVTTNDKQLLGRAQAFQNNGRSQIGDDGGFTSNGANLRLTEFQAAILLEQHRRLDEQSRRRENNGAYLVKLLDGIPGVRAKPTYPGATRHGYHLFMAEYDPDQFAGMTKTRFLEALRAEGIPASGGYAPTNKMSFVEQFLSSRGFQRIYSAARLKRYRQENTCPENDRLCETCFWLTQNTLLGSKEDMEDVARAIERVQRHAAALV